MFHHTVLLQVGQAFDAESEAAFEAVAGEVRGGCEGVLVYALRRNEAATHGSYSHVLFSVFDTRTSFHAYDRSRIHGRVKALLAPHLVSLVVADGEVSCG